MTARTDGTDRTNGTDLTSGTDNRPARNPALQGRAFGVTILAFFALAWVGWGTGGHLPTGTQAILMAATALVSAGLATVAWRAWWRSTGSPRSPEGVDYAAVRRRFRLVVSIETAGLAVVAIALGRSGHPDAIPAAVCAGVGLHFIPLARLFWVPAYYATAAGMCALSAATFALAPATPALWTALPGIGAGIMLYATCAVLLLDRVYEVAVQP